MFRISTDLFSEKNIIFIVFVNWYRISWIKELWYIINFNVSESLMTKCNFSSVLNLFYIINVVRDILWITKYASVLFLYKNIFVYILSEWIRPNPQVYTILTVYIIIYLKVVSLFKKKHNFYIHVLFYNKMLKDITTLLPFYFSCGDAQCF